MTADRFVIGVDFGTDSVRSVLLDTRNGEEIDSSTSFYPRWRDGLFCDAEKHQFRQHPLDYLEGLELTIKSCMGGAGKALKNAVVGISIDTTGSTPVATDEHGTPLSLTAGFENNPNAMFVLWKDHTATNEAGEINAHAKKFDTDYLKYVGGIYSSEWFWAKMLHIFRIDHRVRASCHAWVEHCDWMPFLLTGGNKARELRRSRCAAGHKALWAEEFSGLPPDDFFLSLDSAFQGMTSGFKETFTADCCAGHLSQFWSEKLGLSTHVAVGMGAFDAHMGAVGGQIAPYFLSKVMGTSTCDILVAPADEISGRVVKGICGQVTGSVIPKMVGLEAGQSAFGDTYSWFKNVLAWPLAGLRQSTLIDHTTAAALEEEIENAIIGRLSDEAAKLPIEQSSELAVDWLNGRRTPDANQLLKAGIINLDLGSDAPRIFTALVESTCFGAKQIVQRFADEGVNIKGLIGMGGVAKKSAYIMQMMASVLEMPLRITKSTFTCALGAGMFAAVVSGVYPSITEAMEAMGSGFDAEYLPDVKNLQAYRMRYQQFASLGNFLEMSAGRLPQ